MRKLVLMVSDQRSLYPVGSATEACKRLELWKLEMVLSQAENNNRVEAQVMYTLVVCMGKKQDEARGCKKGNYLFIDSSETKCPGSRLLKVP